MFSVEKLSYARIHEAIDPIIERWSSLRIGISSIRWNDSECVFETDIDQELQKLLAKRADDNGGKRPDIALFSKEGSAIIVEFKAPGVSMDEHVGDLSEYAHLLAAKSGGRLRKFYGYLIGDTVNPLRLSGT
ncbi:hypothetical protein [Bradyrhizobium sp. SSUT77]|uniref:hypothetical protein n=1 Tax=Bradyrhizobium sp. SSUT77 TaxID=3040603 RepID=UPI00244CFFAE|nr:hypothetical protein [Bradyrhizobium sp. SSUT77]MDH2346761.1 hypothetical protein [Bradyrhizobium sp. SSUT77]